MEEIEDLFAKFVEEYNKLTLQEQKRFREKMVFLK